LDHLRQDGAALIDEVIAEQHGEGFVADVLAPLEHGMAETLGVSLPDIVDIGQFRRVPHGGELLIVALLRQCGLESVDPVEMVFERSLVAAGDHEDVAEVGIDGLFDDVLDRRLVDDGEHLLGGGLGRGEETGSQTGDGDHGLANGALHYITHEVILTNLPLADRLRSVDRRTSKAQLRSRIRSARANPPGAEAGPGAPTSSSPERPTPTEADPGSVAAPAWDLIRSRPVRSLLAYAALPGEPDLD